MINRWLWMLRRRRGIEPDPAPDMRVFRRCALIFARAWELAIAEGHAEAGEAELLLATLEHSLVHAALVRMGVSPLAVRDALQPRPRPRRFDVPLGDVEFDDAARAVLVQAAAEAAEHANTDLNALHLLAGFLRLPASAATAALTAAGADLAAFREVASGRERGPSTRL